MTDRAVVLVSGGLDSATCLARALDQGFDGFALSFDYGQRSVSELAAERLADPQGLSSTGLSTWFSTNWADRPSPTRFGGS